MVPNVSKHYETHQNISLGSDGVDTVDFLQKILSPLCGLNFYINCTCLARYANSCSSETVPNVPKQKEMHQNMRLGSNGMNRECSLWKILTRHRGTNFCINCTSLARFCAIAKRTQMHPNGKNAPKHEFRVQCCGCERSLWKVVSRLRATNFHINCTSLARFASSFVH